jgi:hypothetical protein
MMLIAFQSSPMRSLPDCSRAGLRFEEVDMRRKSCPIKGEQVAAERSGRY